MIDLNSVKSSRGGMLVELLLSVALAAVIMPFLFQYQENAVRRAENVVITRQISEIQTVLERYIVDNRENLLNTVGRTITRVNISELAPYGLSESVLDSADKYQMRILKSSEAGAGASLQGVIVMSTDGISALRTRQIVSSAGGDMGFIEGTRAYGAFGTWRADTIDLGVNMTDGIVGTTSVNLNNALYLWRVPSDSAADATMMSALNLGGHNIDNATFFNGTSINFDETLTAAALASDNIVFQNRTTIDKIFETTTSTVSGALSSDSRTLDIAGTFTMSDLGKFSSFNADDLWVTNLTLGGLSISSDATVPVIKVGQSVDMTAGRINAMYATVGFTGSITPRLNVTTRIEDSVNSNYYWDASGKTANFFDAIFRTLNDDLAVQAVRLDTHDTFTRQRFAKIAANSNATISEYMNAISEIQNKVRAKYRQLNLE